MKAEIVELPRFPEDAMIRASVVICVYTADRTNDIREAVESVRGQTLPAHELILVVDHNPDLHLVLKDAYRDAVVVENGRERGLSGRPQHGRRHRDGRHRGVPRRRRRGEPRLARRVRRALRRLGRGGRRRVHAAVVAHGRAATLVPRGVQLGRGLQLPRDADGAGADPQRHGRQRGVPPGGDRRGRRVQHRDRTQGAGPQEQAAGVRGNRVLHPDDPASSRLAC